MARLTDQRDWPEIFGIGCWLLWKWRNSHIHEQGELIPVDLSEEVLRFLHKYIDRQGVESSQLVGETIRWIEWHKPKVGWCKLNTDGAWDDDIRAGCAGVLRGDAGEWLGGFSMRVVTRDPAYTEALAMLEGLTMAWGMGLTRVELESDSKVLVDAVTGVTECSMENGIIGHIQDLLNREWEIEVRHILREANQCADHLAKLGKRQLDTRTDWREPPGEILEMLELDREGRGCLRSVVL